MKPRGHDRSRCTQCRTWFIPKPSATGTQRVCGPECRRLRDNALARRRRAADPDAAREDERLRQRKHREALRAGDTTPRSPSDPAPRHAPPSDANPAKLRHKILAVWDKEAALSRARLDHQITEFFALATRSAGTETPVTPPMSRASLGAEVPSAQGFP